MTLLARFALVAWLAVVFAITLSPHNTNTQRRGERAIQQADRRVNLPNSIPKGVRTARVDVIGNLLLFVPLGFLGTVAFRKRGLAVLAAGVALSAAIESAQALFLTTRHPSIADVATNSTGHLFGLVGASALLWVTTKRVHTTPNPL